MSTTKTHYRTCNICEAMCGIEIKYEGDQVISIRGDEKDPLSKGYICPKAVALQDFYQDEDRLRHPIKKTNNGWEKITWGEAFETIISKTKAIQERYGKNAVATYLGNPNAHNLGNLLFIPHFIKSLGTNNRYSSASADQLPHHVASNFMLGHGLLIPIPDIDRTDYMLIIGGNPLVSNGSMMTAPGYGKRLKAIQERGGKVVVIDPRRTETARKADEHIFIKPEHDALLLMAMVQVLFEKDLVNLRHLESFTDGVEELRQVVKDFTPEIVGPIVGIVPSKIRQITTEMATAESAVCYSRMGASTQSFGGLCLWLTNVFNILNGNFDRAGGAMFTLPAFDLVGMRSNKGRKNSYGRYRSRVRDLPFYNGEFPVSTLGEEILTPGDGQIKALFTIAGNPVLSSPDGTKLEEAFESLEFMVSLDIYLNETTRHADIILPAATGLENPYYDIVFNIFSVRNTAKYAPPLFEGNGDIKQDWEILKTLALKLHNLPDNGLTPEIMLDQGLRAGPYASEGMSLDKLKEHPNGIDLGPLKPCLPQRLQTDDDRIHLAPELYLKDVNRLRDHFFNTAKKENQYPFLMIGRRLLRSHNTWTQNSYRLVKGDNPCTVLINPIDAENLGINNKEIVRLTSATGTVEIEVKISDEMMEGVVSIPQGWGSRAKTGMTTAASRSGVNINDLTDTSRIDELTGNAAFNGVGVAIERIV